MNYETKKFEEYSKTRKNAEKVPTDEEKAKEIMKKIYSHRHKTNKDERSL